MIIDATRNMMVIFLILMILVVYCIYWGLKNDEFMLSIPFGGLAFAVCTVVLLYTAIFAPYKMLNDVEKIMLHEFPESSKFYRYEEGIQNLQYLDNSYTLQTVNIYPDNMVIQFKDELEEPYMEMQTAESFFGKDLGPYKVKIYLPK